MTQGIINAENDARDYEHLAKNPEKMKERFFSGITRFADGKHFEDVGQYDAIVSGLPTATTSTLKRQDAQSGNFVEVENKKAIVNDRTNSVADIVSDKYEKINHSKVLNPLSQAMKHLQTGTWGSVREFKGGNRVQAAVMTNEAFTIQGDSSYHIGFTMGNSYDRSSGVTLQAFTLRGVCANGCLWNAGDIGEPMSRKHIGDVEDDVAGKYREFIQEIIDNSHKIRSRLQEAQEQTFVKVDIYRVLRNVGIPKTKVKDILMRPTVRGQSEVSRKDLYDAITRYVSRVDENDSSMAYSTEQSYQKRANKVLTMEEDSLTHPVEDEQEDLEEIEVIQ